MAEEGAEASDSSSDDDLEVAATARADYKCPLCIGVLKSPVRSLVCIHRYCQACFSEYLVQSGHRAVPCPISGCDKHLAQKDVERDVAFERRVQMYLRQEQNRGQDDGDEEEEEEGEEAVAKDVKPGKRKMTQATQRGTQRRRAVVVADSSSDDE